MLLFSALRVGTAQVGRLVAPVMPLSFLAIGGAGVAGVPRAFGILRALSPAYAIGFLAGHFGIAFFPLAAVVLAVNGAKSGESRVPGRRPVP